MQSIKNKHNENLSCEINEPAKDTGKPAVLLLHALTGQKKNRTIHFIAKQLPSKGFTTIQFDFSGHGESEGCIEDATVTKQMQDIGCVLDETKYNKVVLVGNSFSVVTALAYANQDKRVVGLVLLSGRADHMNFVDNLEKINDKYKLMESFFIDQAFVDDYAAHDPLNNIKNLSVPLIILHGENDKIIPKEDAGLLYSAASSEKKFLFIIPGAGHRYSEHKELVLEKITEFLQENF